jgi:hypothetical protein
LYAATIWRQCAGQTLPPLAPADPPAPYPRHRMAASMRARHHSQQMFVSAVSVGARIFRGWAICRRPLRGEGRGELRRLGLPAPKTDSLPPPSSGGNPWWVPSLHNSTHGVGGFACSWMFARPVFALSFVCWPFFARFVQKTDILLQELSKAIQRSLSFIGLTFVPSSSFWPESPFALDFNAPAPQLKVLSSLGTVL